MSWSAAQYVTFEDERTRPVRDLLAAVPTRAARRVADIGCGPGNSTELLAARYPEAEILGLDSSPDMIAAARKRLPNIRFETVAIERWAEPGADAGAGAGSYDAILANAVLQWLPDHAQLFPRLAAKLAPGGSLAIQMPDNFEEPAHTLMRAIARHGPWAGKLAAAMEARAPMESARWYYELLRTACGRVDVWRTTYFHVLPGAPDAIVEWFKGSALRPFLDPLDAGERASFLAQYRDAVAGAYPALPDGSALLPFPRFFMVATR